SQSRRRRRGRRADRNCRRDSLLHHRCPHSLLPQWRATRRDTDESRRSASRGHIRTPAVRAEWPYWRIDPSRSRGHRWTHFGADFRETKRRAAAATAVPGLRRLIWLTNDLRRLDSGETKMAQEWTPPPSSGAPASVPNYLVLAIITLICCVPLGIVAIVFAARVNGQVQAGDTAGALASSRKAKLFSFIGLGLGIAWWIICIATGVFAGVIGAVANS